VATPPDHVGSDPVLERLVDAIGLHVFVAEIVDGNYREVFTGPGLLELMGGEPTANGYCDDDWPARVHPDDYATYRAAMDRIHAGEPGDVEYRMVGYDGVTRWIWERGRPRVVGDRVLVDGFALDVTRRRAVSAELDEARSSLARIVASIDEHLYTAEFAPDGTYREVFTGPGSESFLGELPAGADPVGAWDDHVHPDDRDWVARIYAARRRGEGNEVTYRLVGFDGLVRWVSDRAYPRPTRDGRLLLDGIVADVTEQKEAERELHEALARLEIARQEADRRSRVDDLTGCYNRAHLAEVVTLELQRSAREGRTPGLLLIDLDHFKRINDTYGHLSGDAVLVQAAARLRRAIRPYDTVARWGGEEFAVLVPGIETDEALRVVGENLRRAISDEPFAMDGALLSLTASVGGVRADRERWNPDALVDGADTALYRAKRRGRNRTRLAGDSVLDDDAPGTGADVRILAEALALAAAARGGAPLEQARATATLAGAVAHALGLPAEAVTRCTLGALVLDAGAVAAPVVTGLADADARTARALAGEEMVRGVTGLQDVALIVRHRNERFDGTGAPDGLLGADIPLEARVVAACAAWCVASADGEDPAAAMDTFLGTRFDPTVLAAVSRVARG
jgi:diguanylate cyclase (GGDEF)-like protein